VSKISELSDGGSLVSSDYLIAVRSGGNVKVRMDQINVDQVDLGDNEFIRLGNSQDLTMVHTSTQSIINQAGIGDLLLQKAGATKLTINATGIDVTGTVTADGLTVSNGTNTTAIPATSDRLSFTAGSSFIQSTGAFFVQPAGDLVLNGTGAEIMRLKSGNVGIGTSLPEKILHIKTAVNNTAFVRIESTATDSYPTLALKNDAREYQLTAHGPLGDKFTIYDGTAGLHRFVIDSSGNVGIGTDSASSFFSGARNLVVSGGSGNGGITIDAGTSSISALHFADGTSGSETYRGYVSYDHSSDALLVGTSGTERMRLDSSGNALFGRSTSTNPAADTAGNGGAMAWWENSNDGFLAVSRNNGALDAVVAVFNRTNGDGKILGFRKDGADVGSIGTSSADGFYIHSTFGNDSGLVFGSERIVPCTSTGTFDDAVVDLGYSSGRFKDLYLSGTAKSQAVELEDIKAKDTSGLNLQTSDGQKRVILNNSGNLLVGGTSASQVAKLALLNGSATTALLTLECTHTTPYGAVQFVNGNGVAGSISVYTTSVTYNTSSDQRLKENIVDAPSASDDIDAIQVRSFDWKADGSHQKYGMVAQELQTVAPEAVSGDPDSDEMMGVDYSKLVPMMLKEIQSLRARIAALES
jgi:hypothetical protein